MTEDEACTSALDFGCTDWDDLSGGKGVGRRREVVGGGHGCRCTVRDETSTVFIQRFLFFFSLFLFFGGGKGLRASRYISPLRIVNRSIP